MCKCGSGSPRGASPPPPRRARSTSGIRSITVPHRGRLELNGRLLHLRGVNLHEQTLATGAALNRVQLASVMARVQQPRRST